MSERKIPPGPRHRRRRQTILPEVGEEGQERLARASVLIVGAGGLGSPVAMYLAAAGVGTLGIVDADAVDESNLQRQIIHPFRNVGVAKVDSAAETLAGLAPEVNVVKHDLLLTEENAEEIVRGYDLAVGCVDNFPARYALNRACVASGKANVFGAVSRFAGQASVFSLPGENGSGPCYQCFFRQPPAADRVPDPLEKGILGPVAGAIGSIMAAEALKVILGAGVSLSGRLLLMDALAGAFRTVAIKHDPACPVCGGERKSI